jgi:5-methylcytosine-specific restriction enzyme A
MARLPTLKPRLSTIKPRATTVEPLSWRANKTSAHARGYDSAWRKLRTAHLAKHPHCVMCLASLGMLDMTPQDVIIACAERGVIEPIGNIGDHIVPHRGNDALRLDPGNVQTLCKTHHDRDKAAIERANGQR